MISLANRMGSWKAIAALVPGSLDDITQAPIATAGTAIPNLAAVLKPAFFAIGLCCAAVTENVLVPNVSRPRLNRPSDDDLITALT